jgi:hypothetical protein
LHIDLNHLLTVEPSSSAIAYERPFTVGTVEEAAQVLVVVRISGEFSYASRKIS